MWLYMAKENIIRQQLKSVQSLAMYVDTLFLHAEEDLAFAASASTSRGEFRKSMGPLIINKNFYTRMFLLDRYGEVVEAVPTGESFQSDFSGLLFELQEKAPVSITPSYYSVHSEQIVVGIVRQTFYGRQLLLELNLSRLTQYVTEMAAALAGGLVFVTDTHGNLMAFPDMEQVEQQVNMGHLKILQRLASGGTGSFLGTYNDELYLMSGSNLEELNWKVVIAQKAFSLFKPVLYTLAVVTLASLGMLFLLIYMTNLRLQQQIVRPLLHFTSLVKQVQSDDEFGQKPDYTAESRFSFSELESLRRGFDQMHVSVLRREQALRAALKEKDVLLREMHHRVKNNLNVVASLLSLQTDQVRSADDAIEALTESRNRIFSMALVHEDLYKTEALSQVKMDNYIHSLISELSGFYNTDGRIQVSMEVDESHLDIVHAVPIGIVINELLTNAFKHAFPDREKGFLKIEFRADGSQHILSVHDNGIPLPQNFDMQKGESLGLKLVHVLAKQLDGELSVHRAETKEFRLKFTA